MNGHTLEPARGLAQAGHRLKAALRWWVSELGGLVGEPEPARSDLVLHLGTPEAGRTLSLLDRRGETPRRYTLETGADDLPARLAAIRGTARKGVSIGVLVDPAACFLRTVRLPLAALPRMREVLAQELEAATPFRAGAVYTDWFVEGEDGTHLKVRHIVLKRTRIDPLLADLDAAGLTVGRVSVGPSEDRAMPVDLLSGGARAVPRPLRGLTAGDGVALILAAGLTCLAFGLVRAHQDATLAALETATFDARRAAPQRLAPPVQALAGALVAEAAAHPPLAALWSALAEALPPTASAETLHRDAAGATATLRTHDPDAVLAALGAKPNLSNPPGPSTPPGLGTVTVRESDAAAGRLVIGIVPRAWTDPVPGATPGLRP